MTPGSVPANSTPTSEDGRVGYDPGPNNDAIASRYGVELHTKDQAQKLHRMEQEFGTDEVHRWADEGMTVEAMGKPQDMEAFRKRQADRSPEIPADIERRNRASLQRNTGNRADEGPTGSTRVPETVRSVVSSPGRSMDDEVQREMEDKMGESFDDVRLHTGPRAARAAESINARAFTVGNSVAFNRGEYQPDSTEGKEVLAHELTHARQDTDGAVSLLPKSAGDHPGAEPSSEPTAETAQRRSSEMHVQPKLEVSSPDDPAEKEARDVAEKVVEMGESSAGSQEASDDGGASRQERDIGLLQTVPLQRSAAGGGSATGEGESKVRNAVSGTGKPLPSDTQNEMESKMGADFSNVSVHTGPEADQASKSIGAEAYTMGSNIAFSEGSYNPSSKGGKKLLAHELTHVAQQGGAQRKQAEEADRSAAPDVEQEASSATVQRGGMSMPGSGGQGGMSASGGQQASGDHPTYTVQKGDYLIKIAREQNVEGGWQKLFQLNQNNPNGRDVVDKDLIYPGQTLTLPKEEEEGGEGGGEGGASSSGGSSWAGGGGMSMPGTGGTGGQSTPGGGGGSEEKPAYMTELEEGDEGDGEESGKPPSGWTIPWPDSMLKASGAKAKKVAQDAPDMTLEELYEKGRNNQGDFDDGFIQEAVIDSREGGDWEGMKEGEPVFDVQGYPPEVKVGYKWQLFKGEYTFFDREIQLGSTPFTAGLLFKGGLEADAGIFGIGKMMYGENEDPFPADLEIFGGLQGKIETSLRGEVRAGAGVANVATMGVAGGITGKLGLHGESGIKGTIGADDQRQITTVELDIGTLGVDAKSEIVLDVGPYIDVLGQRFDWMIEMGKWKPFEDISLLEVQLGSVEYGADGLDAEFLGIEMADGMEMPSVEDAGGPFGEFVGWISNQEDDAARDAVESIKEAGTWHQVPPDRKSELMSMMIDGAVANESENRIIDLLHSSPSAEDARYMLIDAYVKTEQQVPRASETVYEWAASYVDNDWVGGGSQWDQLCEQVGGDGHDYFRPWGFQHPNKDKHASSNPIYDKYIDQYRDWGGMNKEEGW